MNLDIIKQRIKDPSGIALHEIRELKELTAKYPYAQVFSLLYLKSLIDHQQVDFDQELQLHAYRITDRSKLFDFLHGQAQTTTPETEEPTEVYEAPIITLQPAAPEPVVEIPSEEETAAAIEEPALTEAELEEQVVTEEAPHEPVTESVEESALEDDEVNQEEMISTAESDAETAAFDEPEEEVEMPQPLDESLETEMLAHAVAAAYSLELEELDPPPAVKEPDQPRSFIAWLHATEPKEAPVQKSAELIERLDNKPDKQTEKEEKSHPKKEFFSPTRVARESVSEDKLLYSETLANILAAQGNYPKAILAFQQLMLTNPEKNTYFAQKIKELQQKLNT